MKCPEFVLLLYKKVLQSLKKFDKNNAKFLAVVAELVDAQR